MFALVTRTVATVPDKDAVVQSKLKRCMHSVYMSYIRCLHTCIHADVTGYVERECKKRQVRGTRRCLRVYSPGSRSKY